MRDKKTFEIEYEKNCDECTFNPDMAATNSALFKNKIPREIEIKNKDITVDRMRKAYEDSQIFKAKLSRGYYEFK